MKRKSWKRTAAFVTSLAMTTTMLPGDLSSIVTNVVHADPPVADPGIEIENLPVTITNFAEMVDIVPSSSDPVVIRSDSEGEDVSFVISSEVQFSANDIYNSDFGCVIHEDYENIIEIVPVANESASDANSDSDGGTDTSSSESSDTDVKYWTINEPSLNNNTNKYEATITVKVKVKEECFNGQTVTFLPAEVCCMYNSRILATADVLAVKNIPESTDGKGVIYTLDDTNPVMEVRYTVNGKPQVVTSEMIAGFENASGVRVAKGSEVTVVTAKKAVYSYSDGLEHEIELISNEKTEDGCWAATFVMPAYTVTNEKITNNIVLASTGANAVSFSSEDSDIISIKIDGEDTTSTENGVTAAYESPVKITSKVRLTIEYTDESETATFGSDVTKDKTSGNYTYEFNMPLSDVTVSKYHHVHDNQYIISEQKDSIVNKCSNKDNECQNANETIVAIGLSGDKYIYNGRQQGVVVSGALSDSFVTDPVYYAYDAFGDLEESPLGGAPTDAGKYLAKVTVREEDAKHDYNGNGKVDDVELEYNYEIERAPITDAYVVWGKDNAAGLVNTKYGKTTTVDYTVMNPTVSYADAIRSAIMEYAQNESNFTTNYYNEGNSSDGSDDYIASYNNRLVNHHVKSIWIGFLTSVVQSSSASIDDIKELIASEIFSHELSTRVSDFEILVSYSSGDGIYGKIASADAEKVVKKIKTDLTTVINSVAENSENNLVRDTDYVILGSDTSSEAGEHTFTVRGKGNYTGSVTKEWELVENGKLIKSNDVAYKVDYKDGVATLLVKVREPGDSIEIDDEPLNYNNIADINTDDKEEYTTGGVLYVSKPGTYKAYVKGTETERTEIIDGNETTVPGYFGNVEVEWTVDEADLYKSAVEFRDNAPKPIISSGAERVIVKFGIKVADLAPGTEIVKSMLYCNDGTITDPSDLTLEAAATNSSIKDSKGALYASIKDYGKGVIARAYVKITYTDEITKAKKTYIVYSTDKNKSSYVSADYKTLNEEAVKESIQLHVDETKPYVKNGNRIRCSFSYNTSDTKYTIKTKGLLYCNDGTITDASALTLEAAETNSSIKHGKNTSNAGVKDLGNGIVARGYVIISDEVGNETPLYTDSFTGNFVELSEKKANEECTIKAYKPYCIQKSSTNKRVVSEIDWELGKDYDDNTYEVVNYGLIYCNNGKVGMAKLTFKDAEEDKTGSVKVADYKSGIMKNTSGSIKDNDFGTFVRGFIVVKDSNGYETTIMTPDTVNIGGAFNALNTDDSPGRGFVYPKSVEEPEPDSEPEPEDSFEP